MSNQSAENELKYHIQNCYNNTRSVGQPYHMIHDPFGCPNCLPAISRFVIETLTQEAKDRMNV